MPVPARPAAKAHRCSDRSWPRRPRHPPTGKRSESANLRQVVNSIAATRSRAYSAISGALYEKHQADKGSCVVDM
jgi:hypothetical protein